MANKPSFKTDNALINAALFILIGAILCIFRAAVLDWAMTAIGAVLIVLGVLRALKNELVEGVVTAVIGVVVILGGWLFIDIVLLVLGAVIAIKGVLDLIKALPDKNVPALIVSGINILVGAALIFSKWALVDWLFIVIGAVLIIDGVLMLLGKKK